MAALFNAAAIEVTYRQSKLATSLVTYATNIRAHWTKTLSKAVGLRQPVQVLALDV